MTPSRVMYVAEPIDQSDFGPWKESVQAMIKIAVARGWLVYRPSRAWVVGVDTEVGNEIEGVNRAALAAASVVVAHLPAGVPTVGVPREVEWAVAHGLQVLAVTDQPGWSLYDVPSIRTGDAAEFERWVDHAAAHASLPGQPLPFVVDEGGQLPTRSFAGDAGYDLYVSQDTTIFGGKFADVPCGVRVAMPPGVWGRITGRSSTRRKRGLLVIEGVIDSGYRGPLYAGVQNLTSDSVRVKAGERIAQLVLHENIAARHFAHEIDQSLFRRIPGDARGESGFGSSGS